uniref:Small ribosomal subunit protein uS10c n=1 Tax=Dictyopteris divaricata TaxID=156996 RepID=A0A2I4Q2K6_9PHAE|nr:30S ribosomal protein S10 [Dictyopteris divaricata]YP_010205359.1 30S ribosomal protein S10 [Grateloupia livida]AQZ25070.1 30S ribosomal protein S10 [Dictyopteris divaricata]UAV85928.1 30S ribosomal protein S10 [Grateloupia livida]
MSDKKLRIILQSFNHKILNESCNKIINLISQEELPIKFWGPISLPTTKRSYCVLRSPHVNKDSREQFEIRRYKKIIDVSPSSKELVKVLFLLDIPPGVSSKLFQQK